MSGPSKQPCCAYFIQIRMTSHTVGLPVSVAPSGGVASPYSTCLNVIAIVQIVLSLNGVLKFAGFTINSFTSVYFV